MDRLRLEIRAVDELHTDVHDLLDALNRMSQLPKDFDGRDKVKRW